MNRNYWIIIGALAAGLAGTTFAGWRFFVHPLAAQYADQVAQKQDLEQQLQTARATAAQFGKFKAEAENMKRTLDFYDSRTGGTLNEVQVAELLDGLGNGLGLADWKSSVIPAVGASRADIGRYTATITFNSDYKLLGEFLNACVSQKRIVVPESVRLVAYQDPNGLYQETVGVSLSLTVYGGLPGHATKRY